MFLEEWETKPKNNEFILLDTIGDISNPITLQPKKYYQAKDITNIGSVSHEWQSVFHHHTKIILVGKIKEEKIHRAIPEYHEGEFDFEELCKGNLVKI